MLSATYWHRLLRWEQTGPENVSKCVGLRNAVCGRISVALVTTALHTKFTTDDFTSYDFHNKVFPVTKVDFKKAFADIERSHIH